MNRAEKWVVSALVAAVLMGGCSQWPTMRGKGMHGKAIYPPVVQEMRYRKGVSPQQDGVLLRLRYVEGPRFAALFGGTDMVLDPYAAGSGITLDEGWVYINGSFPMISKGGVLRSLWPIIIRSTMAVGSDGTAFIVDCSNAATPWVHCVSGGPVTIWDVKSTPPVLKATLTAGQSAQAKVSSTGVQILSQGPTNTSDQVYRDALALAAVYGVDAP